MGASKKREVEVSMNKREAVGLERERDWKVEKREKERVGTSHVSLFQKSQSTFARSMTNVQGLEDTTTTKVLTGTYLYLIC